MLEDNSESNGEEPSADESLHSSAFRFVVNNDTAALRQWLTNRCEEDDGWTALYEAASRADRTECLELLIEFIHNVSDLHTQHHRLATALDIACNANRKENVHLLLQKAFSRPFEDMSSLQIAALECDGNIVTYLLQNGADINYQDSTGLTALHYAVSKGNIEICRILIENKANLRLQDFVGNFTTHLACQFRRVDSLRVILDADPNIIDLENDDEFTALHLAIKACDMDCIRYLCGKGIKMTCREFGIIPECTSQTTRVEIVKLLLEHLKLDDLERLLVSCYDMEWSAPCGVIELRSVECLSLFLTSGLPKYFLQAPYYTYDDLGNEFMHTPLVHLLDFVKFHDETIQEAMMQLLLDHDIVFIDEYLQMMDRQWKSDPRHVLDSLTVKSFRWDRRFRALYPILSRRGVTVDYVVRCCCNFMESSVDYVNENMSKYYLSNFELDYEYEPELETIKFLISNSCILEPGLLAARLFELMPAVFDYSVIYSYLIGLEPIYHLRGKNGEDQVVLDSLEDFSPLAVEFAASTLKQLCRKAIRKSLRGNCVKDDLMNFRRKIDEVSISLPTCLKNYLLFKD